MSETAMSLTGVKEDILKLILHSKLAITFTKQPTPNKLDALVTGQVSGVYMRLTCKLFHTLISVDDMRKLVMPRMMEMRGFQVQSMIDYMIKVIRNEAEAWHDIRRYRQIKSTFRMGAFFLSIDTQMYSCKVGQKPRLFITTSAGSDMPNGIFGFPTCERFVHMYLPEEYKLFPDERSPEDFEALEAWITNNKQTVTDMLVSKLGEVRNTMMQRGARICLFQE